MQPIHTTHSLPCLHSLPLAGEASIWRRSMNWLSQNFAPLFALFYIENLKKSSYIEKIRSIRYLLTGDKTLNDATSSSHTLRYGLIDLIFPIPKLLIALGHSIYPKPILGSNNHQFNFVDDAWEISAPNSSILKKFFGNVIIALGHLLRLVTYSIALVAILISTIPLAITHGILKLLPLRLSPEEIQAREREKQAFEKPLQADFQCDDQLNKWNAKSQQQSPSVNASIWLSQTPRRAARPPAHVDETSPGSPEASETQTPTPASQPGTPFRGPSPSPNNFFTSLGYQENGFHRRNVKTCDEEDLTVVIKPVILV